MQLLQVFCLYLPGGGVGVTELVAGTEEVFVGPSKEIKGREGLKSKENKDFMIKKP